MTLATDPIDDHGHDRDLFWLAFRYVAGDLGEARAAVFERRLGDDQTAREAVAEAVLLAGAVTRAAAVARRDRPRSYRVVLALAASLLFAAGLIFSQQLSRKGTAVDEGALALTWSGLVQDAGVMVDPSDPLDDAPLIDAPDAETVDAPPPWLVEAAALPASDAAKEGQGS